MRRAVEDEIFPYGEWAVFDSAGTTESGAVEGEGGRWFDLASLTKTFTATAMLSAAHELDISLDAGVNGLLGSVSGSLAGKLEGMTPRRLLTHTSGLPAWYPFYADGRGFFDILAGLPLGAGMVYSDIGYMLLREVICSATGLDYEARHRKIYHSRPRNKRAYVQPAEVSAARALLPGQRSRGKYVPRAGDELRPLPSSPQRRHRRSERRERVLLFQRRQRSRRAFRDG